MVWSVSVLVPCYRKELEVVSMKEEACAHIMTQNVLSPLDQNTKGSKKCGTRLRALGCATRYLKEY